ncbi:MAG: hypothetical protein HQL01_14450, partial [Nitrospirae bacterium]|nr:hypothetical protein [Nitrospirota bacterium]
PALDTAGSISTGASLTLPHFTGAGQCEQTGNFFDQTLPLLTLSATSPPEANMLAVLPLFSLDATGSASNPSDAFLYGLYLRINGSVATGAAGGVNQELPLFTIASQTAAESALKLPRFKLDTEYLTGRLAKTQDMAMPALRIDTYVYNLPIINGATGFPVLDVSAVFDTGAGCELEETLPSMAMPSLPYVNAHAGGLSEAAAAMPVFVMSVGGYGEYKGVAAVAIPVFAIDSLVDLHSFAEGESSARVMVLNIITGALSEYTSYDFNGFCQWGTEYFAEGDSGIYILGADTDDGVPISCSIKTSKTELKDAKDRGESEIKIVPEVYAVVRTPSPFVFKATTDDAEEYAYTAETTPPSRTGRTATERIKLGKGARGRYWTFGIENTEGAAMEIESFEPEVVSTGRRV